MNLNPKQRFQATPAAKVHIDLVVNDGFRAALETALLHYQQTLTVSTDMDASFHYFQRLKGAQEFVGILLNLAEPPQKTQFDPKQNLNHQA